MRCWTRRASPARCAFRSRPAGRRSWTSTRPSIRASRSSGSGIAPLTSMFFYGKNDRRGANDWRPEIHDSDGLSLWTGAGEWIWRPLVNPPQLHVNSYFDDNPARLRTAAAGPQLRSLPGRRRLLRPPAEPVGRAQARTGRRLGQGRRAAGRNPHRRRDLRQHRARSGIPPEKPKPGQELLYGYRLYWGTQMPYRLAARTDDRDAHRYRRHGRPEAAATIPGISRSISPAANSARSPRTPRSKP